VYDQIVRFLFQRVKKESVLVYAVPGHPMVAEQTVQLLLKQAEQEGVTVDIVGGISFLDGLFARLKMDPIEGFALLDGTALEQYQLNPYVHQIIGQVYSRLVASDVKLTLMEVYPAETPITVLTSVGIPEWEKVTTLPLYELDHNDDFTDF